MDLPATLRLARGIESEQDLEGLAPICSVACRVEQAEIKDHMLAIVGRERLAGRWLVEK